VALKLGHLGAPIAVLPLGTANNIAATLGIPDRLDAAIALLEHGRQVEFDVGTVRHAGKKRRFIEGIGVGLFAESMAVVKEHVADDMSRDDGADAELRRDVDVVRTLLRLQHPLRCRIEVDGVKTEHQVLLGAVLNIRSVGPRLLLAPDASPGDGRLDVVLVTEAERATFSAYLDDRIAGRNGHAPRLPRWRGERVRLRWDSPLGHLDDKPLPRRKGKNADAPLDLEIGVERGALRFIAP
jgi:diacylglycerol kinase (ATP)